MIVEKSFRWEMGHRLMHHKGQCYNIHGHSYRANVAVAGVVNLEGMVIDFADIKKHVKPIIDEIDHSFMCYNKDSIMKDFLQQTDFKVVYVDFETTAENIAIWLFEKIKEKLNGLTRIGMWETSTSLVEYDGKS